MDSTLISRTTWGVLLPCPGLGNSKRSTFVQETIHDHDGMLECWNIHMSLWLLAQCRTENIKSFWRTPFELWHVNGLTENTDCVTCFMFCRCRDLRRRWWWVCHAFASHRRRAERIQGLDGWLKFTFRSTPITTAWKRLCSLHAHARAYGLIYHS